MPSKSETKIIKNYYCPNCKYTYQGVNLKTTEVPLHECSALNGLKVPWVLEGVKAYHKVELRDDYLGDDISNARTSSGQVVKSVSTEYADGSNGGTIYLPCARIQASAT